MKCSFLYDKDYCTTCTVVQYLRIFSNEEGKNPKKSKQNARRCILQGRFTYKLPSTIKTKGWVSYVIDDELFVVKRVTLLMSSLS